MAARPDFVVQKHAQEILAGSRQIIDDARAEDRNLTPDEEKRVRHAHKRVEKMLNNLNAPPSDAPKQPVPPPWPSTQPLDGPATRVDRAVSGWLKYSMGIPPAENESGALDAMGYAPTATEMTFDLADHMPVSGLASVASVRGVDPRTIMNAQSVGSDTGGGYTVPQGFVRSLETALLAFSGMIRSSTIVRTSTGEPLPWPTTDDTANEGELLAENTAASERDIEFGSRVFRSYEYSSKIVKISNRLMRDSALDVGSVLGELLGTRIGRILNRHCTTASGDARPEGIVTGATLGKSAASPTAVSPDEIIDLMHSVDSSYRVPGAGFMMNDTTFREISQLKDDNNNYLIGTLAGGVSPTLRGWPVVINPNMADMAASAKSILFGLLTKYVIRQIGKIRVRKLVERYAEYDQTAFLAFASFDGGLLDAGTHPVKYLQQSA